MTKIHNNQKRSGTIIKYNAYGKEDNTITSENAVATKYVSPAGNVSCHIKLDKNGDPYNPLLNINVGRYALNALDNTNRPMFKFVMCSELALQNYLKFLETKYDSFLVSTRREL